MAIDDNASYELTGYQVKDLASKIRAKADSSALASVATSGLYSDLIGTPTIPTVYNGTLTIQQNGTQLGTFSANQSSNTTINITGGSSTQTVFYCGTSASPASQVGTSVPIYKDIELTTQVTFQEFFNTLTTVGDVTVTASSGGVNASLGRTYKLLGWDDDEGDGSYYIMSFSDTIFGYTGETYEMAWSDAQLAPEIAVHQNLQRELTAGSNIQINGSTISATDTTYSNFTGATSSVAGTNGLVPAPAAGDQEKVLHGDGTWKDTTAKLVEMSYGEANSWAKFIAAYNAGSIVYCRASSNANPATGSQTRKAFMAYVNNATSPTSVEFQYVRSQSSKTASQQFDQVFVYKLTNSNGGTWTVESRDMGPKIVTGTGMSSTFTTGANATITLNAEPDYSTSEVDTKVKWTDNKTIYRKVIDFGTLPNSTSKSVAHGISGISRVVKIEAIMYQGASSWVIPYVSVSGVSVEGSNVVINTTADLTGFSAFVTVYYTKS